MKKLKIYLDTSVISHLKQEDVPDKMADTLKLWDDIKAGKFDVYLSETTLDELSRCSQPKQDIMFNYLNEIETTSVSINSEIEELAKTIISAGILTAKSYDDCLHIASAVVSNCDYIVSWNFKHIANIKTNRGVRLITINQGYKDISLIPPTMLLESEE